MKRYLSTLAWSGLLSIGALAGASAFAAGVPRSVPATAPTVEAAGGAFLTPTAQPTEDGQASKLPCTTAACQGKLEPAVLVKKSSDSAASGLQFVRGGFGGGFHGMGGGFHGMGGGFHGMGGGFHGMGGGFHGMHGGFHGFHGGHFHGNRFFGGGGNWNDWGWGWYGLGLPWLYPWWGGYYDGGYYGYRPAYYYRGWHHRHSAWCRHHYRWHRGHRVCVAYRH